MGRIFYFPKNGEMKPRDQHPFFDNLTTIIAAMLCSFLVIGVNGISMLLFAAAYSMVFIAIVVTLAIVRGLMRRRLK